MRLACSRSSRPTRKVCITTALCLHLEATATPSPSSATTTANATGAPACIGASAAAVRGLSQLLLQSKAFLRHAACRCRVALNSWGPGFADRGRFKLAYGLGGVGNPADTYGLVCLPAPNDTAAQQRLSELRLPVKHREDGCFDYTVDLHLTPDVSFIASQLDISLVQLVRKNKGIFPVVNVTYTSNTTDRPAVDCADARQIDCVAAVAVNESSRLYSVTVQRANVSDVTTGLAGKALILCVPPQQFKPIRPHADGCTSVDGSFVPAATGEGPSACCLCHDAVQPLALPTLTTMAAAGCLLLQCALLGSSLLPQTPPRARCVPSPPTSRRPARAAAEVALLGWSPPRLSAAVMSPQHATTSPLRRASARQAAGRQGNNRHAPPVRWAPSATSLAPPRATHARQA